MTNFIPLFPLSIVIYPNENLNLHIFEPKYKHLINDCLEQKILFGLPVVLDEQIGEWGTLIEITEIVKKYETGEMDIKTKGVKVFKILESIHQIPDKMYSGAIVNYPANNEQMNPYLKSKVLKAVHILYKMLHLDEPIDMDKNFLKSYDFAHKIGMSLEQEYEVLSLMDELHRLEFIRRHLAKVIPVLSEMDSLKKKIKMNGHFKVITGFKPE